MSEPAFKTLFVCKGNLFRSVIAEAVFRHAAGALNETLAESFIVSSCGIDAQNDRDVHPDCEAALAHLQIDAPCQSPVKLSEALVREADLVVAMTRQQSYLIANLYLEHKEKCFSLLEINGCIWTLLGCPERGLATDAPKGTFQIKRFNDRNQTVQAFLNAAEMLKRTPREYMYPLEGVRIGVYELMSRFSPCFNHVSAIQDPLCGPRDEVLSCAEQIRIEVRKFFYGLLEFASRISTESR